MRDVSEEGSKAEREGCGWGVLDAINVRRKHGRLDRVQLKY